MKKILLLIVFTIFVCSCQRNDQALKEDATECVKSFIEAFKAQDEQTVMSLIVGNYQLMQNFNPHWELEDVSFSEDVGLVRKGDNCISSVIVKARYHQQESQFIVRFGGDSGREGNPKIYSIHDYLAIPINGVFPDIKYVLKREHGIDDIYFTAHLEDAMEVGKCVEAYIKCFTEGNLADSYTYYPKSQGHSFIMPDSLFISNIAMGKDKEEDAYCYRVNCNGSGKTISFMVYPPKNKDAHWEIYNSNGLFPIDEKKKELEILYNLTIDNVFLNSDLDGEDYVKNLRAQCEKKIADDAEKARREAERARIAAEEEAERARIAAEKEAKRIKEENNKKEHRAYWERIGLVIKKVKMTSSVDKDGDKTKGVYFSVWNPTKKTIKYVIADIAGINAVGDRCTREQRCRGIGPIPPQASGEYEFNDALLDRNNIIDDLSVSFKVIYTDGSSKNVRVKDALMSNNGFDESWWN